MNLLLAVDGSDFSQEAEQAILEQFRPNGIEVRVLNVIEPISSYISADLFPHLVSHSSAIAEDRLKQAKDLVARAADNLNKAGFHASGRVEDGDPKTVILDEANKWPANLIVLGSHGLKGLSRFLMGSVSAAVAQHAKCSVEIVRPRRAEENG